MGLLNRALSFFASAPPGAQKSGSSSLPSQGYLPTLGGTPSSTGQVISQATAMSVSAVYACVTIRSQDVARCTPRLYRRDATGKRVLIAADQHPLAQIFRRPNSQQTWFEWMEQMNGAYLLRGNTYAAKKRDGRGAIRELIAINPDAVLVMEGYDGGIFYNVNRVGLWQMAQLRAFPPMIPDEDILHLRGISFNSLVGASTIGMARDAIGSAMGLEQQGARLIANGARPSVVLQAEKKLSEEAAARLKRSWSDLVAGINNTGTTAVLEEGIKAQQMQITSVDMEFMAQRNFQVADIARFYSVPPHKLGTEQMRGINLVQVDQDYVSNTIMPDLHRWEQKFDRDFGLAEQGIEIDMDETVLLRADIATRYNAARIALLSGWSTVNEIRAGENQPPVQGGDEVYRPLNMAALGSDVTGTAPDGAGRPPASEGGAGGADDVATGPGAQEDLAKAGAALMRMARTPASPAKRFDADQPRDSHGRLTDDGSVPDSDKRAALKKYTGADFQAINRELRGIRPASGDHDKTIRALDSFLDGAPRSGARLLYRGVGGLAAQTWSGSLSKGSVITDPGFVSATTDLGIAKDQKSFASQSRTGILIEMSIPAGAKAADISSLSDNPSEKEILIARKSSFKIASWNEKARILKVSML